MKRLAEIFMLSSLVVLAFTSCEKHTTVEDPKETGRLSVKLDTEGDFVISSGAATKSSSVDLSTFYVEVESTDGTYYKKWDSYSSMPEIITLPADEYNLTAANGTLHEAEWETPYYLGTRSFTVDIQELSSVSMTCYLANVKVTVNFSDEFISLLDDVKAVVTNGDNGVLEFSTSETRAGYFSVPQDGVITVTVTAKRKTTGEPVQETLRLTQVAARQWHKINIGVATSGSATLDLTIDDTMVEKEEEIIVPDADDIIDNNGDDGTWDDENPSEGDGGEGNEGDEGDGSTDEAAAPTLTGASFNGSPFDLSQTVVLAQDAADDCTLDVNIKTAGNDITIQNLFVTINAPTIPDVMLSELGLLGEFDMANLDPSSLTYETLTNEPICLVDPNSPIKGKTEHTFSVGKFMSMLAGLGTGTNQFSIRVVDSNGKSASATLTVQITE